MFILFLRLADPANVVESLLDENKDHLLDQARSEIMKQEHKVESLNNCINEIQQQACAQRQDLKNTHHGYIYFESRREQVRLQEEVVMKEKALRENQIRSNHEDKIPKPSDLFRFSLGCNVMNQRDGDGRFSG